jgi:ATP-dependent metalloprotease
MLIIAATNLENELDPAMTRAGRFDKIIRMSSPDLENRKKLMNYYLNKVVPILKVIY